MEQIIIVNNSKKYLIEFFTTSIYVICFCEQTNKFLYSKLLSVQDLASFFDKFNEI